MGDQLLSTPFQISLNSHASNVRVSEGVFYIEMDGLSDDITEID